MICRLTAGALLSLIVGLNVSFAQESSEDAQGTTDGLEIKGPIIGPPVMPVETTLDMSELPIEVPLRLRRKPIEVPLQNVPFPEGTPLLLGDDSPIEPSSPGGSVLKEDADTPPEFSMPNPNFEGIAVFDPGAGFIPPDTNGDVGPHHYVQTVNAAIAIFDKEGNTLAGPVSINTLFAPLDGPCATDSVINPIVNYDPLADRWLVMGFPFATPLCIAVSQTGDPVAGGWFLYAFDLGVSVPDYPKLGVWPDAYYLGLNAGPENVFALDRKNMLSGNPASFVGFGVGGPLLLPADLDGPPPPKRTPAPFARHIDGDIWGGVDRLEILEFSVDFADPLSSTFDLIASLPTDPFSARLCGDTFFGNCAEQPNGVRVETLPVWLMWRLQYRNFRTHETLVANHTIDVDPVLDEQAGIRWYELRRHRGRPWKIFQQGDFASQDPTASSFLHRWMGSIAMDRKGNIALGFSASSSTEFPSVRYVGRRNSDPAGLMPQGGPPDGDFTDGDFTLVTGAGSQQATR